MPMSIYKIGRMNSAGLAILLVFTPQKQGTSCCVRICWTGMCSGGGRRYGNFIALQKKNCSPGQILKTKLLLGMFFNVEIIMGRGGAICVKTTMSASPICLFTVVLLRRFGICSLWSMTNISIGLETPWNLLGGASWMIDPWKLSIASLLLFLGAYGSTETVIFLKI